VNIAVHQDEKQSDTVTITLALTMDQDTATTRKPLSTFKENTRGSLKSIASTFLVILNILLL